MEALHSQGEGKRCLVIGAGIIGLCCARALQQAGWSVVVIDAGHSEGGASGAAGGILCPLYPWHCHPAVQSLAQQGQTLYPELAAALQAETGLDPRWRKVGMLVLDESEQAAAEAWATQQNSVVERLSAAAAAALQPGLRPGPALWLPGVACIDVRRLLRGLARGVTLYPGVRARGLQVEDGRVQAVYTDQGRLPCCVVLLATGARNLLPGQDCVRPVRGQMIAMRPRQALQRVILSAGHYLVPRGKLVLAGSTLEEVGFDQQVTPGAARLLRRAAVTMLPTLAACTIRAHWAGLRPATPDGLPLIGAVPNVTGLYMASGHYRNGIASAPATARQIAALLTRGINPPAAFQPARLLA